MQIKVEILEEILIALPKLSVKEAEEIADKCEVSKDTVYRQYRKLRDARENGAPILYNPVIIEISALAGSKISDVIDNQKRVKAIERQLSKKKAA